MASSTAVCVIDGDPAIRDGVETLLETADATVRAFSNATEFFDAVDSQNAQVVVCADQLRDANGLDVFRRLKDEGFEGAFALLLSRANKHLAGHARRVGVTHVFRKPLVTMELMRFLRAATRKDRGP